MTVADKNDAIPVLMSRCNRYARRPIVERLDLFAEQLGLPSSYAGHKVLLKPNLISGRAPPLACTNGVFLAAVAEWFVDRGARVAIGDSPAFGTAKEVMRRHGILDAVRHLPVTVLEFTTPKEHVLSHGVKIGISEEALACDLLVNLPKVKAHNQMRVTMAVKNFFGIVVGPRKAMAHMKNGPSHRRFGDLMLDLVEAAGPSLTIVDAVEVMHRSGPVGGEPLAFGCLAAGRQALAVDTSLLAALEVASEGCPIHEAAAARRLPGCRVAECSFPLAGPEAFFGAGFETPALLNPVVFNPFRFAVSSVRRLYLKWRGAGGARKMYETDRL